MPPTSDPAKLKKKKIMVRMFNEMNLGLLNQMYKFLISKYVKKSMHH